MIISERLRAIGDSVLRRYFTWLPDKQYLRLRFYFKMGRRLNLKNPRTFQEKLQWLKLYNRRPEYVGMVDKYAVKNYVSDIIGKDYVIPTIGVWDSFDEIDFDKLPDRFVLKTTHGGGGTGVVVCKNKAGFDRESARQCLENSLKKDIYRSYREWPYRDVPKRILAEEFLEIPMKDDLTDYKVYCFNGTPRFIQVIQDRHSGETIDFFDTEWNHQDFYGLNPAASQARETIERPACLKEMLQAAGMLAAGTDFVRVDLYHVDNHIYFGELTFYPASGMGTFTPESWNLKMGELLKLQEHSSTTKKMHGGGCKYLIYTNLNRMAEAADEIFDYKFFCFNGEPRFFKLDFDRFSGHKANYYDMNWNLLPFGEVVCPPDSSRSFQAPPHFDRMVNLARKLSKKHSFLRVDLYNVAGKIYFGELTFYPASGMGTFTDEAWNDKIGELLDLPRL